MTKLHPFTVRRIKKQIEDHRAESGQLPTLGDFESAGFTKDQIESAIKAGAIERYYVTLTNGTIVKGYKIKASGN